MKLLILFVAILISTASAESSSFIVGGSDATIEEFPYMAAVYNLGIPFLGCGGTILNARNVLTVRT